MSTTVPLPSPPTSSSFLLQLLSPSSPSSALNPTQQYQSSPGDGLFNSLRSPPKLALPFLFFPIASLADSWATPRTTLNPGSSSSGGRARGLQVAERPIVGSEGGGAGGDTRETPLSERGSSSAAGGSSSVPPTSRPRSSTTSNTLPGYRPNMSQLTDEGNVVVGRGKSGWNKLLTSPTGGRTAPLPIALSAARDRGFLPPAAASTSPSPATPTTEAAEERDVWASPVANSSSAGLKGKAPSTPVTNLMIVGGDEDDPEIEDEENENTPDMFHGAGIFLLAGGIAGAVSRTATAPFDRLKVYLITSQDRPPPNPLAPPPPPIPIDGNGKRKKIPRRSAGRLPAAARALWKQGGGPMAFWTGNGLNVVKIFPESAIKFLSYESSKRVFAQYWDKVPDQTLISNSSRFVSGGIGGVVSQFAIYPIETLKTRVMSSTGGALKGNALIAKTALDMWRAGGIRLFFKGLPAGLIGVFPYSAIDMSTYEGIKLAYAKWSGKIPEFPGTLVFGAISGGIGATSVYPLNLVRTRLQAQGTPSHPQTYTGIRDAAMQCYVREGWRGFYKGLTPTLVKVIPAVAISYAVYEKSKQILFGLEDNSLTPERVEADET